MQLLVGLHITDCNVVLALENNSQEDRLYWKKFASWTQQVDKAR